MKAVKRKHKITAVKLFVGGIDVAYGEIEKVKSKHEVWLSNFAVRQDYRGQGYGQKALQYFIDKYGVNALTCSIHNDVAYHIYTKYGFIVVNEEEDFMNGASYFMKRRKK